MPSTGLHKSLQQEAFSLGKASESSSVRKSCSIWKRKIETVRKTSKSRKRGVRLRKRKRIRSHRSESSIPKKTRLHCVKIGQNAATPALRQTLKRTADKKTSSFVCEAGKAEVGQS
jgi:hypothetical protein